MSTSSSSSSYAETEPDDNFTGNDNDDPWSPRWEILDAAPKIIGNRVQMDVAAGNVKEEIRSKWFVAEAFDVVVHYYIENYTDANSWRIDLKAEPQDGSNDYWTASRLFNTAYFTSGIHSFDQYDDSELTLYGHIYATNNIVGRLRLKRDAGSSIIRAYFWNGMSYTEMTPPNNVLSGARMKIILRTEIGDTNPSLDAYFDKFNLVKGAPAWSFSSSSSSSSLSSSSSSSSLSSSSSASAA